AVAGPAFLKERAADEVRLVLQLVAVLVLERGLSSVERGGLRWVARGLDGHVALAVEAKGVARADLGALHELAAGNVLADHSIGCAIHCRADRRLFCIGTRVDVCPGVALEVGTWFRRRRRACRRAGLQAGPRWTGVGTACRADGEGQQRARRENRER